MFADPKRFVRFGPFTFRLADHVLLRDGTPIDLPPREGEIFGFLLQNRDHLVSKEELRRVLWPGLHISDNSIDGQVCEIRRALGRRHDGSSYIKTKYKRGWQLIGEITEETEARNSPILEAFPTGAIEQRQIVASPDSDLAARPAAKRKWLLRTALVAGLAIIAAASLTLLPAFNREAKVIEYIQLTNDGRGKDGPLLTDGHRIFFTEEFGASSKLMSIPIEGGEPRTLDVPLSHFTLQDISSNGSTLLLRSVTSQGDKLWTYPVSGGTLQFLSSGKGDASWSPRGSALAFGEDHRLSVFQPGDRAALAVQFREKSSIPDGLLTVAKFVSPCTMRSATPSRFGKRRRLAKPHIRLRQYRESLDRPKMVFGTRTADTISFKWERLCTGICGCCGKPRDS